MWIAVVFEIQQLKGKSVQATKAMATRDYLVDLERDGPQTPWGIRLVGGSDLNTPLIITKVYMANFDEFAW